MKFESIISPGGLDFTSIILCTLTSLGCGLLFALIYFFTTKSHQSSKSFLVTLVILPMAVQTVIMMVNGNIGAGVAVAGAFALVRFRSVPGTAKEICCLFCVMAIGLATGMGYLTFALFIAICLGATYVVLCLTPIGKENSNFKKLEISVPENIDYMQAFEDLFEKYTKKHELQKAKSTDLGSMFELTYDIQLKDEKQEKEFLDELRLRNGNLPVCCKIKKTNNDSL